MRRFLMLALSVSALLATTSAHAHSHPRMPKGLALSVNHTSHAAPDSVALASLATGPTVRASFSAPRVSSSFRSTPSYRSFSATPSRSYSFSRASSPSISPRPASTSVPRTYSYPLTRSVRSSTPVSSPAEVHHYHNTGGVGMSTVDYLVLNQVINGHNRDSDDGGTSTARFTSSQRETIGPADSSDDKMPTWLIVSFVVIGVLCVGALIYGLIVYLDLDS